MDNRVGVIGASLWTPRLAASLEKHGRLRCSPVSEVMPKDLYRLLTIFGTRTTIRVGFRPGQIRVRGLIIDLVCLLYLLVGGRLVFYWTGSDVQRTAHMLAKPSLLARLWSIPVARKLVGSSRNCVAAPWLVSELNEMGYSATCIPFPTPTETFEEAGADVSEWPAQFTVLSYVPDHNFENYCGPEIVQLARRMPQVDFRVMGGQGEWCSECPGNLKFLGWTDSLEQYLKSVVVLRAVRHDALGGTVREALLCGRHVLYTYPHECTELLPDPSYSADFLGNIEDRLKLFLEKFQCGSLNINHVARGWVSENLSEKVLAKRLVDYLVGEDRV
ncbi:hypothetical protein [Marinobacter sp. F4216]|uniref:hypothetical protein n=1 Tax=Marinobacter sp. F4216 TaxID=2874281 RepID=UPI001CBBE9D5|nr:hypothetical protein [Marinobacter sp. F4216]MBZ2168420.1 hypothetical protein [Marinobacter sp. F4216]